jgi:hypothetical protein
LINTNFFERLIKNRCVIYSKISVGLAIQVIGEAYWALISATFYARLFGAKVSREAFLYLHFRFKLFLALEFGTKALIKCW